MFSLEIFDMSKNKLGGIVMVEFCELDNISVINLDNNYFIGVVFFCVVLGDILFFDGNCVFGF